MDVQASPGRRLSLNPLAEFGDFEPRTRHHRDEAAVTASAAINGRCGSQLLRDRCAECLPPTEGPWVLRVNRGLRVGGHFGRFCRHEARGGSLTRDRPAATPGFALDSQKAPAEPREVPGSRPVPSRSAHSLRRYCATEARVDRSSSLLAGLKSGHRPLAGFQVAADGRFWVAAARLPPQLTL